MRKFLPLGLGCVLLGFTACSQPPPPPPEIPFQPVTTIKDIMDSIIDPSADVLWESVQTVISAAGIEEHQPRTDEEWATVRRSAVQLLEATNLLLIEGRHVAKPGEKSAAPGIELEPEEIDALINGDRPTYVTLALALQEPAMVAFKAIEARDAMALSEAGLALDRACENCHKKYWYPNAPSPTSTPTLVPAPGN